MKCGCFRKCCNCAPDDTISTRTAESFVIWIPLLILAQRTEKIRWEGISISYKTAHFLVSFCCSLNSVVLIVENTGKLHKESWTGIKISQRSRNSQISSIGGRWLTSPQHKRIHSGHHFSGSNIPVGQLFPAGSSYRGFFSEENSIAIYSDEHLQWD